MTDYAEPSVPVTGGAMPLLGFGTWQIDDADAPAAVSAALEAGYRHIDTATGYSNQRGVGKAIADSGLARDDVFVTTKLPPDNADRVRATIEESLDQLGLDHLDLWLVHWPPNGEARPDVWEQVVQAQTDGLTRAVGVSNYSLAQIDELIQATGTTPAVNQIKWSPAEFDRAVADGLRERGVVLEGYSPFKASNLRGPDAGVHRPGARRRHRPGHRRVARRARVRRHPEVVEPRPHPVERRRRDGDPVGRRGHADRRARPLRPTEHRTTDQSTGRPRPAVGR